MELPAFQLPQIQLPFDIPVLLHPFVDHFVIAIPILVLIVEIINLLVKKRAIGVITFLVLILGSAATLAAYLTGTVDGKAAFDVLGKAGQDALEAHKVLGMYLVIGSAVVVVFKLFSAMVQRGLMKAMYLLVLVVFSAAILKQGKEGGELVYRYGANVKTAHSVQQKATPPAKKAAEAEVAPKSEAAEKPAEAPKASEAEAKTEEKHEAAEAPKASEPEAKAEEKDEKAETVSEVKEVSETKAQEAEKTAEAVQDAVEEKGKEVAEKAADVVKEVHESVKEAVESGVSEAESAVSEAHTEAPHMPAAETEAH